MTLTTLLYFKLAKELPIFIYLFRKSEATTLTVKELQQLLKPEFSESGSNARMYKGDVHSAFIKYVREAASKSKVISAIYH